jgi:nucleotide-binding universal stress UspA family protein
MVRRILLAYDGSQSAENALTFAVDLAHRYDAQLHVLTVARLPDFANEMAVSAGMEGVHEYCNELLRSVRERLEKDSIALTLEVARVGRAPSHRLFTLHSDGGEVVRARPGFRAA